MSLSTARALETRRGAAPHLCGAGRGRTAAEWRPGGGTLVVYSLRMSSIFASQRLHPADLADALELWALRREKVIEMLDIRAARHARKLAISCRVLAAMEGAELLGDSWAIEWRRTRQEALAMFTHAKLGAPRRPAPRLVKSCDAPYSERPTRVLQAPVAMDDLDPPTRVGRAMWNLERDEVQVA